MATLIPTHPYEFKMIKAQEINVDPTYQRDAKKKMVREIIRNFDYHKVNPVKVVFRNDGQYYAFDGQQTTIGLRSLFGDNYRVPCLVYYDVPTWADEAVLFEDTNESKAHAPVSVKELWKSKLARGDETAVAIKKIVEKYGLVIKANATGVVNGQVKSLRTLEKIYNNFGATNLEETISIISAAWEGDPVSLTSPILKGMALFVNAYGGEYDKARLIRKLSKISPQVIIRAGRSSVASGNNKYAREILSTYNSNLSSHKLDERKL